MNKIIGIFFLFIIPVLSIFPKGQEDPQIEKYNQALDLYKKGNLREAGDILTGFSFHKKANEIEKYLLQSAINYKSSLKGDSDQAVKELESSMGYLKRVLELDPENSVAANNLEKVMLELKKKQQAEQEQQNSNSQNKENDSDKDKLEKIQKEQEKLSSDNYKNNDDHKNAQEDLKNRTEELNKNISEDSSQKEKLDKAIKSQEEAMNALEQGEYQKAAEQQHKASEYLKQALTKTGKGSSEEKPSETKESPQDQLLDNILNNEQYKPDSRNSNGNGTEVERNW